MLYSIAQYREAKKVVAAMERYKPGYPYTDSEQKPADPCQRYPTRNHAWESLGEESDQVVCTLCGMRDDDTPPF